MKRIVFIIFCMISLVSCGVRETTLPISLIWEMGANGIVPGQYENTFYIVNTGKTDLDEYWTIYYNQIGGVPVSSEDAPLKAAWIMSTYYNMYPAAQYQQLAPGDTLKFTFRCRGGVIKETNHPEGAYIVLRDKNGNQKSIHNIPVEVIPFTRAYQWTRPTTKELPYPDGNYMYEQNAFFGEPVELDEFAIFPSPKKIEKTGGNSTFSQSVQLKHAPDLNNEAALLREKLESLGCSVSDAGETIVELALVDFSSTNNERYELEIKDSQIKIAGASAHGVFNGCQTLLNILGNTCSIPANIPNAHIADEPDLHHRGVMLDVSRNFSTKENVLKMIDWLANYKMNILHLHLTDDEAWRIEIPGLEELIAVGSRRGHTIDESDFLQPAFSWGWDASADTPANGYFTRDEFIEILKYANQRHITVLPEVDIPGHSRAAIKAMNARYRKYIDADPQKAEEYLLIDFADTSKYLSAQNFTDNVLNVALPSSYRFVEKVIDEIDKMYNDAGLKLTVFHIGGDEVPRGAWEGSDICREFMKEKGMTDIKELKDYFLEQVLPMLAVRGIQPAGWEEVAMRGDTPNPKFANSNVLSYCWNTLPEWKSDELPYKLANAGYSIILANVTKYVV